MNAASRHPIYIRDFRYFLIARLLSTFSQNAIMIVIAWQAYHLARMEMGMHAAAARLGLIGLAQFLPLFFLTPVAGWVADRYDRRRIGGVTNLLLTGLATVLTAATVFNFVSLPLIYTLAVFVGVARCFSGPALSSITARVVPPEQLPRAIAMSSMAWQTAAIVGPAFGGALYAAAAWAPYALGVSLFAVAGLCLQRIKPFTMPETDRTRHPLRQMVDGLIYVRRNRLVLGAITLDLMAVLLAGATALLPVYARDILHVGSAGLGQLASAMGVGALATAIWLGAHPIENNVGNKMLFTVACFGLGMAVFGASAFLPDGINHLVALVALFSCGIADMISVFVRQSLIQIYTPDEMRGRVSSVSLLTISASNELGEAESGFLASLVGPVAAVIGGGIGAIIVTLLWSRLFPELGRARRFDSHLAPVEGSPGHSSTEAKT